MDFNTQIIGVPKTGKNLKLIINTQRKAEIVENLLFQMRRVAEFKRDNACLLDGLLPEQEKEAFLEHQVVNVMKGRDDKGRRVLIVNVGGTHQLITSQM